MEELILNECGQATTEYVLMLAALVLLVIGTLGLLGTSVLDVYIDIADKIANA